MSRKCSKPYHFFLNCLKANRPLFPYQPQIIRCGKGVVEFVLAGISSVRFRYYPSCSTINVFLYLQGEEWERVWIIYEPEGHLDKKQREERFNRECFGSLLEWCNDTLTKSCYAEFLQKDDFQTAQLVGKPNDDRHWVPLSVKWSRIMKHYPGPYHDFFIPLRKQKCNDRIVDDSI